MVLPIVAVVGRPNVGKSTLVNRLVGAHDAIVHESSGVTRDRSYHRCEWSGRDFMLIDTGGIEMATEDAFGASIREQAFTAAHEADAVVFLADGRTGPIEGDDEVARILQKTGAPVFLAVNKLDDTANDLTLHEFWGLGLGEPWPLSALHGHGTGDLLDAIVEALPVLEAPAAQEGVIDVAIVGRPNAGKSSLFNKMVGQERAIVSDVPGTTRDAIDTVIEENGTTYRLVDTAGLRRRSQIDEPVEYYSFVRAMRALDRADVALLLVDASQGITAQDQRVATFAAERGCAVIVLLNKWDLLEDEYTRDFIENELPRKLGFLSFAPVIRVSALTGRHVGKILSTVSGVYEAYARQIATSALNRFLADIRTQGHTVTKQRRTLRLKYMTQVRVKPPTFTVFVNHADLIEPAYERYLENRMREAFAFEGTPIRLRFRKGNADE